MNLRGTDTISPYYNIIIFPTLIPSLIKGLFIFIQIIRYMTCEEDKTMDIIYLFIYFCVSV